MSDNFEKVKANKHRTQLVHDFLGDCESQGLSVLKIVDPDDKRAVRDAVGDGANCHLKVGLNQALGILRDNLDNPSVVDDYAREAATLEDFLKHQRDQGIHLVYFIDRVDYVYEEFTPRMDDMLYGWIGVDGREFEREKEEKIRSALAETRQMQEEENGRLAGSASGGDDGHQQRDSGAGVDSAASGGGEDSPDDKA